MKDEKPKPKEEPKPDSIEEANLAAERLEKANEKLAELLTKQEAMKIENTLGGETTAGEPKETQKDKELASAKKLLEGTGYEDILDTLK